MDFLLVKRRNIFNPMNGFLNDVFLPLMVCCTVIEVGLSVAYNMWVSAKSAKGDSLLQEQINRIMDMLSRANEHISKLEGQLIQKEKENIQLKYELAQAVQKNEQLTRIIAEQNARFVEQTEQLDRLRKYIDSLQNK